jgi:hypothetical protein
MTFKQIVHTRKSTVKNKESPRNPPITTPHGKRILEEGKSHCASMVLAMVTPLMDVREEFLYKATHGNP